MASTRSVGIALDGFAMRFRYTGRFPCPISYHYVDLNCFAFAHAFPDLLHVLKDGCPADKDILTGVVALDRPVPMFYVKSFNGPSQARISVIAEMNKAILDLL